MTNTPHPGETGQPAPGTAGTKFWDDIDRTGLRRDRSRQWFAGVAAGIARRVDVDPILIRAAFIALTLFGGIGVVLYLVAWLLMPDDSGRIMGREALQGGSNATGAIVLLIVTALVLAGVVFGGNDGFFIGWGIIPLGIIAWFVWRHQQGQKAPQWTTTDPANPSAMPGAQPTAGPTGAEGSPSPYAASAPHSPTTSYAVSAPAAAAAPTTSPSTEGPSTQGPTAEHTVAGPPSAASGTGQGGSHGGWQPPPAPPVPPRAHLPLAPPPPPRPRRRGAGFAGFLITLGVAIVGYGVGFALDGPVDFPGSPQLLGMIAAVGGAGLTTMIIGLMGRRSLLSAFLVMVLGLGATAAGVGDRVWEGERGIRTWTPTVSSTTTRFEHGAGEATLDLRPLFVSLTGATPAPQVTPAPNASDQPTPSPTPTPTSAAAAIPQRIEVQQGAGELTIIVPEGADARIHSRVSFGDVVVRGDLPDGLSDRDRGDNDGPSETLNLTLGNGEPSVVVDADLTVGQITIKEG